MADTPAPTTPGAAMTAMDLAMRLQTDWWIQMLGLNSAWWKMWAEVQPLDPSSWWPPQAALCGWFTWPRGAEQLG